MTETGQYLNAHHSLRDGYGHSHSESRTKATVKGEGKTKKKKEKKSVLRWLCCRRRLWPSSKSNSKVDSIKHRTTESACALAPKYISFSHHHLYARCPLQCINDQQNFSVDEGIE